MQYITAKEGQSIWDVALQHAGHAAAAFDMALLNNKTLTDALVAGEQLLMVPVADADVVAYYKKGNWQPATAEGAIALPAGGIGYMGIGIDLLVS